jgi:DNA-binding protein HU-beta
VNKQDLIAKVAQNADISKTKAAEAVDAVIDAIKASLKKGDAVRLVGFGTFHRRTPFGDDGPQPTHRRADQNSGLQAA